MATDRGPAQPDLAAQLLVLLVLAWEIAGRLKLVAGGALPALSAIAVTRPGPTAPIIPTMCWRRSGPRSRVSDRQSAGHRGGGAVCAVSRVAQRLMRGVNIAVFALPAIAIAPILVLTLEGMAPRVVLARPGRLFRHHDRHSGGPVAI
jgi:sulfonate transport system permease protein